MIEDCRFMNYMWVKPEITIGFGGSHGISMLVMINKSGLSLSIQYTRVIPVWRSQYRDLFDVSYQG
jgi:hypothetical protein